MNYAHPMLAALRSVGYPETRITDLSTAYRLAGCPVDVSEWLFAQGVPYADISAAQRAMDPALADVSATFSAARRAIAKSQTAARALTAMMAGVAAIAVTK